MVRSKRSKRLPVVLTQTEVARIFVDLEGIYHLMAAIIYGGGLRLRECVKLRIKDIDLVALCQGPIFAFMKLPPFEPNSADPRIGADRF